ncbi:MAG: DUF4178 domain-containing protein [Comamonadaceae bacterium]|nr:MAG: DUF4178 domain-containing protein [Comamonadaceae bacterium]
MATTDNSQRSYRAPCPGCGAPVEFRSAQSAFAVCPYCQSTVARNGEVLSRVGKMAELFDDFSPLQLMAAGKYNGKAFTLVGRLQYRYGEGTWTEWQALHDDGTTGTLGEDNGAYVFSYAASLKRDIPPPDTFRVGATTAINGKQFSVASNEQVSLISAQGELPHLPPLNKSFAMVELRNADGQVLSIDYGVEPPQVSLGSSVLLEALQLTGLKEGSAKDETGRQFNCPNCGAPVEVALANTQSVTCRNCASIIDLTRGIGGELRHAEQDEPVQPLIPLGTTGKLQGIDWQVVGFQHRMGHDPADEDEEHFGWDEYLLFNQKRGFSFLVDTTEGWSLVKPVTGAPVLNPGGKAAAYLGTSYSLQYSYEAETTYVAGEFYWQVQRGQKTSNRDFASKNSLLSMEQTPREVTWSSGSKIASDDVAKAFKLDSKKDLLKRDAAPVSASGGMGCVTVVILFVIILVFLLMLSRCTRCDPRVENCSSSSSSRSSGGSFGGFSSGGGHK